MTSFRNSQFLNLACALVLTCQLGLGAKTLRQKDGDQPAPLDPALVEVGRLVDVNSVDDADANLKEYLLAQTPSAEMRLACAKLQYKMQLYYACIDQLTKVVEALPKSAEAWRLLGDAYQQVHKPGQAAESYKKFVELQTEPQSQYQTLITSLEETARDEKPLTAEDRKKAGDYLSASTTSGIDRWAKTNPIKVYIKPGKGVPEYRPEFDEALRGAFDDWSKATDGKFQFEILERPDQADMVVAWTNDLHAPALTAEVGIAHFQCGSSGIESATVDLLTVDPFKQGPVGKQKLHDVCLHEIGHALGLKGHSPYESDVMYPICRAQGLSARDVNTLLMLYSPDLHSTEQLSNTDAWGRPLSNNDRCLRLTNEGYQLIEAGDYAKAVQKLEEALKFDSKNSYARNNLAVAANNLAIAPSTTPQDSLKLLRKALYWSPQDKACLQNLESAISNAGKNPGSFHDRLALAEECAKSKDWMGACVEYQAALKLKNDPAVKTKLDVTKRHLAVP